MTVADLIEKWFQSKKLEKFWVHRVVTPDDPTMVLSTIRYNHTRLVDVGNGTHFPEWLFYEIMEVSEFEVAYLDANKKRRILNAHDPQFFEKLEDELKDQIRRIENHTTEAVMANKVMFGFGTFPPESAASL
jgi:hypothetical protein